MLHLIMDLEKTTRREERDTLKPYDNYVQTEGFLKFNKDLVEFIGDYWDYKGLFNGFLRHGRNGNGSSNINK